MIRCGTDIIEVERIKDGIENIGDKFLNRIYTETEIEYCNSKNVQKYQSFAGRFAAKEAIFKALTDVIENKYQIEWKDFEIINNEEGKPLVKINNEDIKCKIKDIDVSISHCKNYAEAVCIAEII